MQVSSIVCDRCKTRVHRPVYVDNGEYCAPCAVAVVSDRIRRGYTHISIANLERVASELAVSSLVSEG